MAARNINKEEFNQLSKGDKPVLVDYWALLIFLLHILGNCDKIIAINQSR